MSDVLGGLDYCIQPIWDTNERRLAYSRGVNITICLAYTVVLAMVKTVVY